MKLALGKLPLVQNAAGVEGAMFVVVSELANCLGAIGLAGTLAGEFADVAAAFATQGAVGGGGDYR